MIQLLLKQHYCDDKILKCDGENWMMSEYKLPFLCDDLFEMPEDERYPGGMVYCKLLEWTLGDNNDGHG